MSLLKINGTMLNPIHEVNFGSYFDKEKKLQNFTENNLETLFGLQFVSTEFNLESFWLDSLAYDPETKSFVIIEYKKVENFSLMDQGQTYLNLVLEHKDSVLLEYIEKTGNKLNRSEIDWSQTRVIFIGPAFNTYQKRALSDSLPFELWKVSIYEGELIEYDQINPVVSTRKADKKPATGLTGAAAKEINVYTQDDLIKPSWELTKELIQLFEEKLFNLGIETKVKYNQNYIAYVSKHGRNYVEIKPQQQGLHIYYRMPANLIVSKLDLEDCSKVGRQPNGISRVLVSRLEDIDPAVILAKESFFYLHKNIYPNGSNK